MLDNKWKRSSKCPPFPGCIEVMRKGTEILVRDDKSKRIVVRTNSRSWKGFIDGVKAGEFDL